MERTPDDIHGSAAAEQRELHRGSEFLGQDGGREEQGVPYAQSE